MKILDRYLGRTVFGGALLVLLILLALSVFITFIGEFNHVGTGSYGIAQALGYSLLSLPVQSLDLFPTATLMGALLGLGGLASSNELMVIRTAGVSTRRIALSALLGGLAMAILVAVVGEYVAPPANRYADNTRSQQMYGRIGSLSENGIWARDGDVFVNVREFASRNLIRDIYIYRFDEGRLASASHAASARFRRGRWTLDHITTTRFDGIDKTHATRQKSAVWSTLLNPGLLRLFVVDPDDLSAGGLLRYIGYLQHNNLETTRYRIAFWSKIVRPFTVLAMALLSIPFVFGPLRSVTTGQRMLFGILTGVAFYLFNTTVIQVGEVVGAPPLWTAWLPTVLLAIASFAAVSRLR
ncbi:MAG TPA: LPS export ABC transporter permease LptG [Gammaproteobacteria bacterium]|nr:LPS export ABC transporter permease LptG [Gammaproteobacteria bacterium]